MTTRIHERVWNRGRLVWDHTVSVLDDNPLDALDAYEEEWRRELWETDPLATVWRAGASLQARYQVAGMPGNPARQLVTFTREATS